MLARPEIGTREHILLWLASRDPNEEYDWCSYSNCACGKYAREVLGKSNLWWVINCVTGPGAALSELNVMASYCKSFGELEKCARKRWAA